MSELPKWPDIPLSEDASEEDFLHFGIDTLNQLVSFWESRCRMAVEALEAVRERGDTDHSEKTMYWLATDAVYAIGPLPNPPSPAQPE